MDVTPQGIRAVQFREKLRGYHPDDVDTFVASVAKGVEDLEARVKAAEAKAAELESRQSAAGDAEDSLRRTLVLAQRTADLAIQEARDEAAKVMAEAEEQRVAAQAEADELRARLRREAEDEGRNERDRLVAERAALLADVEALRSHVERERERLRIYFTDQLRKVDEGEPAVTPPPAMQAAEDEVAAPAGSVAPAVDDDGLPATGVYDAFDASADDDGDGAGDEAAAAAREAEEDPFLAELRRAVTDERPLGPREDDPTPPAADDDGDDGFDLFAKGGDDPGGFGSRLRRKR